MDISKEDLLRINKGFGGNLISSSSIDFAFTHFQNKKLGIYKKLAYLFRAILVDHPFSDGNGRTGRMMMNHILHLKNYPPTVISRKNRKEYLNALNTADKAIKNSIQTTENKDYNKLLQFTKKEYITSYWDNFLY